jgi:hypothetical protein
MQPTTYLRAPPRQESRVLVAMRVTMRASLFVPRGRPRSLIVHNAVYDVQHPKTGEPRWRPLVGRSCSLDSLCKLLFVSLFVSLSLFRKRELSDAQLAR